MDRLAEGEFREYVAKRQAALYRVAYLLTGHREDAEDLLQTALAKLALHWNTAKRTSVDAYIRKILYHQQVTWWRRRGHRREHPSTDPPETPVDDVAGSTVLRLTLEQMLARLTKRQRAVVVLRYYEDLPESEVAEILGCSVGTVRSQTHRTLARLRAYDNELFSIRERA